MRIIGLLKENGIEAIPLKGSVASEIIFHDMGLYPSSDIDILVSPSDLEKTGTVLFNAGYSRSSDMERDALINTDYHLIFHRGAHVVEVHWNLVKRYFSVAPSFWWEDTVKTVFDGSEITLLSVERCLLYAIFRLFFHAFRPLKFLLFIAALLEEYDGRIDWQKFFSSVRDCRMEKLSLFTLRLFYDISGRAIPHPALDTRSSSYVFLKRLVISGFFTARARIHLRMILYTFLLDSPLDTVRVIFRRIFPDPAEIRLRYELFGRPRKVLLYYLLNPLLLLLKRR